MGGRLARDMCDAAVVRDPEQKGAFGTLAAKARQRPPDRDRDLLEQILAIVGSSVQLAASRRSAAPRPSSAR